MITPKLDRYTYRDLEGLLDGHRRMRDISKVNGEFALACYHSDIIVSIVCEMNRRDRRTDELEAGQTELEFT
jgi:hypothetical protein